MQECAKRNVSTETKLKFHVFQDERFVDLNLYQYGWEQTEPLHSYGPYARNHYLFHYVISGKGLLFANEQEYAIEGGQGFLIAPGQVTTYRADEQEPWEYTWIEFDGLRAHEALNLAGISGQNPVYSPASTKAGQLLQEQMLFLVNHSQDSPMRQIGYGFLFLDQLVQSSASHQAQSPRRLRDFYMKEALSFIEQHYSEDISMEVMLAKKMPMSKLAEPLKIYPQVLENVRVTDKKAAQSDPAVQEAVKAVAEALGDTGRILVRESGTEPLVRVMVEAPDHDTCQKYVDEVVNVIDRTGYRV